jgi:hypothetical protein
VRCTPSPGAHLLQRMCDAPPLGEVLASRGPARYGDVAPAHAHAQEVVATDVAARDLRKQVVQRAVRVRDEQNALQTAGSVDEGERA